MSENIRMLMQASRGSPVKWVSINPDRDSAFNFLFANFCVCEGSVAFATGDHQEVSQFKTFAE